jgi:pimeloyl-ACP methyl ester carboxylesterase
MYKNQFHKFVQLPVLFFVAVVFFASCSKNTELPAPQYFVSATQITELSKTAIDARLNNPITAALSKFSVKVYKIVYKTKDVNNNDIQASGAVFVPTTSDKMALISYQHGTLASESEAPSNFPTNAEAGLLPPLYSSIGYVISAPDYLGYGESKQIPHPYEHRKTMATASIDMLRATKEFCQSQGINLSEKLFLTGYSQGGSATMSMQKMMEEEFSTEFKITASVMGAGAYNKTAFSQYVISQNTTLSFIGNYIWVLQTYNSVYNLNRPLTSFFTEPNATRIQQQGPFANNVAQNPQVLFNPNFRNGIINGTDTEFLNVLKDNDVFDWQPKVPTLLVHGRSDDFVIPLNSQSAFDAMRRRGATNVELSLVDGNHFTAVPSYILQMYSFFLKYNN